MITALLEDAQPVATESGRGKNKAITKKQIDKNIQFNDDELLNDFNPVDGKLLASLLLLSHSVSTSFLHTNCYV